jgi:hypothetical protein
VGKNTRFTTFRLFVAARPWSARATIASALFTTTRVTQWFPFRRQDLLSHNGGNTLLNGWLSNNRGIEAAGASW